MEEIKRALHFIREASEIAKELSALSGELPPPKTKKGKGYVIKAKESSLIDKFLHSKRADLNLSLEIEPPLGEPISLKATLHLRRGGTNNGRGQTP